MQEVIEGYRLSPQQARIFALDHGFQPRVQCVVLVDGELKLDVFATAIEQVVSRHEILRTTFQHLRGMEFPLQVIEETSSYAESLIDLSDCDANEQQARLEQLSRESLGNKFNSADAPLRIVNVKLAPRRWAILLTLPAVASDVHGLKNLIREITRCYGEQVSGETLALPEVQYADCSQWQNELLESEEMAEARSYWSRLNENPIAMQLPFAQQASPAAAFQPEVFSLVVASDVADRLEEFAAANDVAPAIVLLACWQILLSRLLGHEQISLGLLAEGRKYDELKNSIGLFAKYLPITGSVRRESSFSEVVSDVADNVAETYRWQEYFDPRAEQGGNSYQFEYSANDLSHAVDDVRFSVREVFSCLDSFAIKLSCVKHDDYLATEFHYDAGRFAREDVSALAEQYETLLREAMAEPSVAVSELKLTSAAERKRVCEEFNATAADYERGVTLHGMFERAAVANSDAVAVSSEAEQLSYRALNARANQLAHWLRQQGLSAAQSVGAEQIVGVALERSLVQVTALLAILKAGAAYLPLAVSDSAERQALLVRDAGAQVVLTAGGASELQRALGPAVRVVDLSRAANEIAAQSEANVEAAVTEENLAYVIYTSGSSGRPKGVMITHAGICNRLQWMAREYERSE